MSLQRTGCKNPEMFKRLAYLAERVDARTNLAGSELVGPTEWAEAVSLCRYAVDRVGECGGVKVPDYTGSDLSGRVG